MPEPMSSIRLVAAAACMVTCLVVGCGSSDDGSEDNAASTAPATAPTRAVPEDSRASKDRGGDARDRGGAAEEKQRITAVVEGMYRDLGAGDAAGVCDAMSTAARKQIAQQVPVGSGEAPQQRTCEASLSAFLDAAASAGVVDRTTGAEVKDVAIEGQSAVATVSFRGTRGKIRLRKENGDWRFGSGAVGQTS